MSDRRLFDQTSAIPRGTYTGAVRLDRLSLPDGARASGMSNPIPTGKMGSSGIEITRGADAMRSARSIGMQTAPVAMNMAGWRRASKAGLIAGGGAGLANMSRRQEILAHGLTSHSFAVTIDLTDLARLGERLGRTSQGILRGHAIISRAINDGLRKFSTVTKRDLQAWTGIRRQARITEDFKHTWSSPATMTGALRVAGRHTRITTEDYGAAWSRANPGGTHHAWNRPTLAAGSFMVTGSKRVRGGLLMKRTGKGRLPIAPLYGPSMAREVNRHHAHVQAKLDTIARTTVITAATRMMSAEIAKAGG